MSKKKVGRKMKKNKRVIILLSVLILGIGISLAYFVGKTIFSGTGATTEAKTATVNGSILDIEGELVLDNNMYPGHKTLSKITATATGDNEPILYNLIWEGKNGLNTTLKYKVYKTEEEKNINITCTPKKKVINGEQHINEECDITGIEELGKEINEGEIKTTVGEDKETIILATNELITSKKEPGETYYYYAIIEYPDTGEGQNLDLGHNFEGKVKGEISNSKADINLVAFYQETEEGSGKYEEVDELPKEGYSLNQEKTKCSDEKVKVSIKKDEITLSNVNKSGVSCYLYFKKGLSITELVNSKTLTAGKTEFGEVDIAEHANTLYTDNDDFGTTYYYRGKVKNNWVKFGKSGSSSGTGNDLYWRIIRINGDGTIRLIYAGEGEAATSDDGYTTSGDEALINEKTKYYDSSNQAEYVGFEFIIGQKHGHGTDNSGVTKSNVLTVLNTWFGNNLADEFANGNGKIDKDTGFCNDRRNSTSVYTMLGSETDDGGTGNTTTYYGAHLRLRPTNSFPSDTNKSKPTFKCKDIDNDYFTYTGATVKSTTTQKQTSGTKSLQYPVGLITADEVTFAGGLNDHNNQSYYLNNQRGQYWTMSPYYSSTSGGAQMFFMNLDGYLTNAGVSTNMWGVRPVINLKADITFKAGGTGEYDNPYIVE